MDHWCRKCGERGSSPRPTTCDNCGAGLWVRPKPPPSPGTHAVQVLSALYSFPAFLFAVVYVGFSIMPHYVLNAMGGVMLLVASIKFARATMAMGPGGVRFPEVDVGEMFESRFVWLALVYTVVFTIGPVALLTFSGVAEGGASAGALAGAVGLLFYAPMGLVLMLQSNSIVGLLSFHVGLRLIAHDFVGYLGLAGLYAVSQGLTWGARSMVDNMHGAAWVVGLMASSTVYAFAMMFTFGVAGLFIRKHARAFDFPVDDADWVLAMDHHAGPAAPAPSPARPQAGPVLVGTLVMDDDDDDDDPPPVVGRLVE